MIGDKMGCINGCMVESNLVISLVPYLIGKLISIFSDVGFKDKENKEVVYFTSHVQFVCFSLTPAFLSKCAQSGQLLGQRVMRFETISPQLIRDNTVEEHEKYLYFFYQKIICLQNLFCYSGNLGIGTFLHKNFLAPWILRLGIFQDCSSPIQ